MTKHLFLCTIGPVQSFIAQARKTRDLYCGSKLLSELIKAGMNCIAPDDIIFPATQHDASYPNRFLGLLQPEQNPKVVGEEVESKIRSSLLEWAKLTLEEQKVAVIPEGYYEQLSHQLEIFWIALPFGDSKNNKDYAQVYPQIESTLGALKNVRVFEQYMYQKDLGESGRKCSLDGENNALFYRGRGNADAEPKILSTLNKAVQLNGHQIRKGEGLSAVSFLKRFWQAEDAEFESVSGVALADTLHIIREKATDTAPVIDFLRSLNDQFLYKQYSDTHHLRQKILEESVSTVSSEVINTYQEKLWSAAERLKKEKIANPVFTPYYSIVQFDGDRMGEWLSGSPDLLIPDVDLMIYHRQLADCLGQFASDAKEMVEIDSRKKGRVIYAGGDDLLAFVNINHLFPLLADLRKHFHRVVAQPMHQFCQAGKFMSFSAGICIAHIKEPLGIVLGQARHMEKEAKQRFQSSGKDAFGISLFKGSGERHETYWRFRIDEGGPIQILDQLSHLLREGSFSDKFILSLDRAFSPLVENGQLSLSGDLVLKDLHRLILRSYYGKENNKDKECAKLTNLCRKLFKENPIQWENFISALHITNFIENELNLVYDNEAKSS